MTLIPTPYFRWVHKELSAPCRVLQQWWGTSTNVPLDANGSSGEWRDIPDIGYLADQPKEPQ